MKNLFTLVLLLAFSTEAFAQEEKRMFDPLDEIQGKLVFIGYEDIGKTKGQNNYVDIKVQEYTELNTGVITYYVALKAVGLGNLMQTRTGDVFTNTKFLTVEEAKSLKNAFLALKPVTNKSGKLNGEMAYYSIDDDLSIAKRFKSRLHGNQDRGVVSVGYFPREANALLNINDFNSIDQLLTKAIGKIESYMAASE